MFAEFVRSGLQELIDAELAAPLGAGRYERADTGTNYRNGTSPRPWPRQRRRKTWRYRS
nr:transposase [Rhodococcus sp. WY5]